MMYGYATNETEELMPYPITLAHKLAYRLSEVRKQGILNYLRPDGKSQVTVVYDEIDFLVSFVIVVLSTQHNSDISQDKIFSDINKYVFDVVLDHGVVLDLGGVRDRDDVRDRDRDRDRDQNHLQSPYLSPRGEGEHQNQFPKLRSLRRDERGGGNHPLPVSRVLCEEGRHLPQGPQEDH